MQEAGTIIARLLATGNEWVAFFPGTPGHAYYSDNPAKAVRRLLEGTDAEPGVFEVLCGGDRDNETTRHEVTWDAPLLYFPCSACQGRGEYLGLLVREVCQGCGGRKIIAV
jgi:hypothetical protein